jgi:hypothetical protein
MEEKKLYTINDCKNFDDIKEAIEDIIDQYELCNIELISMKILTHR